MVSAYDNICAAAYAEGYVDAYATSCAETFARAVAAPGTEEYAAAYASTHAEAYLEAKAEVDAPGFAEALAERRAAVDAAREMVTERKIAAMMVPRTETALVRAYDTIKAEGQAEGRRLTLARQIRLRFGALSRSTRARLDAADEVSLDLWAERILVAATLDALFAT